MALFQDVSDNAFHLSTVVNVDYSISSNTIRKEDNYKHEFWEDTSMSETC